MAKKKRKPLKLTGTEVSTIRSYDLEAEKQFRNEPPFPATEEFLWARSLMSNDPRLLDIGCGHGRAIPALREMQITRYVGIDASTKMVEVAKREYPGYDIRVMNLFSLGENFPAGYFDAFFANFVFMHILPKKMQKALSAIRKVLKQDGIGIITLHEMDETYRMFDGTFRDATYTGPVATVIGWPRERIFDELHRAKFEVCERLYEFGGGKNTYLIAVRVR